MTTANRGYVRPGHDRTERPTIQDIAWAAGIYEGEGSCHSRSQSVSSGRGRSEICTVTQADSWLTDRLRNLFGGSVYLKTRRPNSAFAGSSPHYWTWTIHGMRARGFLMTIYIFLSPRRKEQVRKALGVIAR